MKPEHRDVAGHRLPGWSVAVLLAFWPSGCERSKPRATPTPLPTPAANALIQFPEALRTEDESVNAFIAEAIRVCASEDYDAFRLLWSALEEPIGKQQFQAGFRATRRVTILDLAKRRLPDGELVYLVYCLVELDPREVPEPTRDIVLLLRKEQGDWRIATPPQKEARALKARFERRRAEANATSNGPPPAGTGGGGS
jgi:hypothetical protein